MKNLKMLIHCLGLVLITSAVSPIIGQEGVDTKSILEVQLIEYEGRKYVRSEEGFISLIEKSDKMSSSVSTIIYEGRTYSRSDIGYIKLVEDNEQSKDQFNLDENPNLVEKQNSFVIKTLYPNPAQNRLNFSFNCEKNFNENIIISIVSVEGQVNRYNVAVSSSEVATINISNLEKGVYNLNYENESGSQSIRFIKQ